jgi:PKHD-type hydroxylase
MQQQTQPGQYIENDYIAYPVANIGFFTRQECAEIVHLSTMQPKAAGTVGTTRSTAERRDSRVAWVVPDPGTQWVYQKVEAAVRNMNQLFKYELTGFREALQVATYSGGGQYGWHIDIGNGGMSTRKLSISVQLTDENEYAGGNLEFLSLDIPNVPRSVGSIIVFPSYLPHRVTPVTSGTRQSLVAWIHGTPFR